MCRAAGAAGASDGHLPSNLKGRSNDRNFGASTNRDDYSITICLAGCCFAEECGGALVAVLFGTRRLLGRRVEAMITITLRNF